MQPCSARTHTGTGEPCRPPGPPAALYPLPTPHRVPRFLRYCRDEGAYRGYPYEEEPPEEDSLANHLDSLHLGN